MGDAIKVGLGKLDISQPFGEFIHRQLQINGFEMCEIRFEHIAKLIDLPFHHRDPFDRLLIAQCIVERMPIVSVDSVLNLYPIQRLW